MAMVCVPRPRTVPFYLFTHAFAAVPTRLHRRIASKMTTLTVRGQAKTTNVLEGGILQRPSVASEEFIVAGCGAISIDYLASVAQFPQPDEKIRSVNFKVQGGGNAGNCLTAAARLGLRPRILSKVAEDAFGKLVIDELIGDGVDTSFIVVSESGTTSFTYVIVDRETNTRTCINSPGYPPLTPKELPDGALTQILDGSKLLYLDGRLPDTAVLLAEEAKRKGIPILVDAERKRERLDDLLALADYVVCSAKFPQAWTEMPTLPEALISISTKLPSLKFVIVTLGAAGCVMLEKTSNDSTHLEILDPNKEYELLLERRAHVNVEPTAISSKVGGFQQIGANGDVVKQFSGRLLIGTAETIPASELVDTTGSGDAFIGAVLYSLCTQMSAEKMLAFGAVVAGANCRALGARGGLPYRHDSKLIPFLGIPAM
ncbi:hypothetical protein GOP47_0027504 [Adiantum capillus-veneris]|nr:hypothetical protein GOP47_0027504 [Adiantum capillus-veneris]